MSYPVMKLMPRLEGGGLACPEVAANDPGTEDKWWLYHAEYDDLLVRHILPTYGYQHTMTIDIGEDGEVLSYCTCGVEYDLADDGVVVVIHEGPDD